jgi:hypothetical protein
MVSALNRIVARIWIAIRLPHSKRATESVWHVDRDGRVRTDKDRPVVLRASK